MFIYVIVCSENLKIYVGQHKKERLDRYLQQKYFDATRYSGKRSHLYAAMRAHPKETWSIHPLVSGVESHDELDELERHFIKVLKSQHPDVGYNICDGGEGFTGPHTAEWRQQTLDRVRKYWAQPEAHQQRSEKMKAIWQRNPKRHELAKALMIGNKLAAGRIQSAEERKIRSEANKGKQNTLGHRLSEDHKRKMAVASRKQKGSPVLIAAQRARRLREFLKTVAW